MNATEARSNLEAEADMLLQAGLDRLESIYWENGGAGWLYDEPRYHMWKGIDELFSATHFAHEGDIDAMEERIQDGLNHIWMASYIAHGGGQDYPHGLGVLNQEIFDVVKKKDSGTTVHITGHISEDGVDFDMDVGETTLDPDDLPPAEGSDIGIDPDV